MGTYEDTELEGFRNYESPFIEYNSYITGMTGMHREWYDYREAYEKHGDMIRKRNMLSCVTIDNPPLVSWPERDTIWIRREPDPWPAYRRFAFWSIVIVFFIVIVVSHLVFA